MQCPWMGQYDFFSFIKPTNKGEKKKIKDKHFFKS